MTEPTLPHIYKTLAREMPQTMPCPDVRHLWGDAAGPCRCGEPWGTPGGDIPVTAADLAAVDKYGRPSGWLWKLWSNFIWGNVRHNCGWWRAGDSLVDRRTASEAIARALYADLTADLDPCPDCGGDRSTTGTSHRCEEVCDE